MRSVLVTLILVGTAGALAAAQPPKGAAPPAGQVKLWAGMTVSTPLLIWESGRRTAQFSVACALMNDGDKAVDPDIESSRFVINGKECPGWAEIVENGPKDDRWKSLPPKEHVSFKRPMAGVFTEPGVYRVSWKGKQFQSAEVVFRVVKQDWDKRTIESPPVARGKLWAGITVLDPLIAWDGRIPPRYTVGVSLVNDGDKAVDPEDVSWVLVANGNEVFRVQLAFRQAFSRLGGLP